MKRPTEGYLRDVGRFSEDQLAHLRDMEEIAHEVEALFNRRGSAVSQAVAGLLLFLDGQLSSLKDREEAAWLVTTARHWLGSMTGRMRLANRESMNARTSEQLDEVVAVFVDYWLADCGGEDLRVICSALIEAFTRALEVAPMDLREEYVEAACATLNDAVEFWRKEVADAH